MAKELPYFKFYINEWSIGDISLESYKIQGVFLNICIYYWSKDCDLTIINLKKKFKGLEAQIDNLIKSDIIKIDGEYIDIIFLNEQLKSKEVQIITNKINGSKGGRPNRKETKSVSEKKPNGLEVANPNLTNIEESIGEERKGDQLVDEGIDFFRQNFLTHHLHRSMVEVEKVPKEKIDELMEIFIDQKIGFDEIKGKEFSDLCKNFYYWAPKYLKSHKKSEYGTKNNGTLKPNGIEPPKGISSYGKL